MLRPIAFTESLRDKIPIAGGVLKGLSIGSLDARADPDQLIVEIPSGDPSALCLTLESRDGMLFLEAAYRTSRAGLHQLYLPTRHASEIRRRPTREFGALAHLAEACPGKASLYLPVRWTARPDSPGPLTLFVSSGGADVRVAHDALAPEPCNPIIDSSQMAFDVECKINLSGTIGHVLALTILRTRFQDQYPPMSFKIRLP